MLQPLIYAALVPAVTTAMILAISGRWRRRDDEGAAPSIDSETHERRFDWVSPIAFAVAYGVCHLGVHGWPGGQLEAWEWLLLLVPSAALAAVVDQLLRPSALRRMVLAALLAGATAWFLVPSFQSNPIVWRVVVGAAVFVLCVAQQFGLGNASATLTLTWIIVGALGVPVLIASANAKFSFLLMSIVTAASVTWLFGLIRSSDQRRGHGAIPVTSVVFPSLFLSGYFNDYGDVPLMSFILLVVAPLGACLVGFASRNKTFSWARCAMALTAVSILGAAAVYLAWPALTAEPAY